MKRFFFVARSAGIARSAAVAAVAASAAMAALMLSFAGPATAADVGVSVHIGQPGVYGRIDSGRFPYPQVVVAQPVIIARPQVVQVQPQPVYMWVPAGHRKDWRRHCRDYGACGVPVYFVQDRWYDQNVRGGGHDHGYSQRHRRDEREREHEYEYEYEYEDEGKGKRHVKGKGKSKEKGKYED